MATLNKHGQEIGRVEYINYTKAYFANGDILKNYGDGWKLYGKVKAGIAPSDAVRHATDYQIKTRVLRPAFALWEKAAKSICLNKRQHVIAVVEVLGNDIDGVWSELNDSYDEIALDFEGCADLCHAYEAAQREAKALGKV